MDTNQFKSKVKEWMNHHPDGQIEDLEDFCESLIPQQCFSQFAWLVPQTIDWYKHVLSLRETRMSLDD